ncbi:LptF/LptG family permease [Estrella lausannensis]|uniref:Permease, YjgP/YjgQ family n=1 Tax=Estrella lausannensis TaxID=483423 RepID=A0A0H5DU84_9BACT|nr:LptF/LptG family permease [Estrella lausannensis]CRX39479.1 Permease, YjgP/YjgQ family [Estrella lausannensis]
MTLFLKKWQRYFALEFFKTFSFVLLIIFLLYTLIDFSSRKASFQSHGMHFSVADIAIYYVLSFFKEIGVLLPFSALISTLRTVSSLSKNRELIALLAGGISLQQLMRPFLMIGIFLSLLLTLNQEFFYPRAVKELRLIEAKKKLVSKKRKEPAGAVKSVQLQDGSTLLYSSFDPEEGSLGDVYWIRSIDDIYRIQTLKMRGSVISGLQVEHFVRKEGKLLLSSQEREEKFASMEIPDNFILDTFIEKEELPLSDLLSVAPSPFQCTSDKECALMTTLLHRLILPWIALFAVLAPLPFLIRHTRSQPMFLLFGFSIFFLVFTFLLFEAASILGRRQALTPVEAIVVPFGILLSLILYRHFSLR